MDFFQAVNTLNRNRAPARREQRAARNDAVYSRIRDAVGGGRAAQLSWALEAKDPESEMGTPIGRQHPGHAAVLAVRAALAEYQLPVEFRSRYVGMERYSGRGAHGMDDGVVSIEVAFRTLSGIDRVFDVPVIVHAGHVLKPVVLVDQTGEFRTIAQSTFDDIVERATFYGAAPERRSMFSPPPAERRAPVVVPIVRPGMFGLSPINKQLTAGYVRSAMRGHNVADMPSFAHAKAAAGDDGTSSGVREWDDEEFRDAGERELPEIQQGASVKLKGAADLVGRDGQRWHFEGGTKGCVVRDAEGDGRFFIVKLDKGFMARLPLEKLSAA